MRYAKKPRGIKHRIREEKKREERIGLAIFVVILIAIISVSGFFMHSMLSSPPQKQKTNSSSEPRAAIVDHLSLTCPNQTFIETATAILAQAGHIIDYYPSEQVTVEFYRNLATYEYGLIILRVHSAAFGQQGTQIVENPVAFFTSEPYSRHKYLYEQLTEQIGKAHFVDSEASYFGIFPDFVKSSMNGKFKNTIIIMMGCDGLTNTAMAQALVEKGAKAYISWNASVSASHTDTATISLMQHFLLEGHTLSDAVAETMQEVGPDPAYKSELVVYPVEAGNYTIKP